MQQASRKGIVLMNLGSPDSTAEKDVKRYLMEFLMDGRVIDYPYLFRKLLVGGIIVPFRAARSARAYRKVWTNNGSPLVDFTRQVQAALQQQVQEPVEIAMRYGNPSVASAFDALVRNVPNLEEVIAIPLYPHYAMSSYETAVAYAQEVYQEKKYPFRLSFVKPFFDDAGYIHAMCENIRPYLQQAYDQILFSYHSIPRRHVTKADITGTHCLKSADCCSVPSAAHAHCYRHQCITTAKLVADSLGIPESKRGLSFQSRLGSEEWLKPYTALRLTQLPGEGIKRLLVVCPAFVSDCLETLEEIAMEGKESFMASGGTSFTLIPCMNTHPLWVATMAGWIKAFAAGSREMALPQTEVTALVR